MTDETGLLIFVLLFWAVGFAYQWRRWRQSHPHTRAVAATRQRLLRPRTPADCPACRQQMICPPVSAPAPAPVRPWQAVKSRRGAPKRIPTQGFACPNQACMYYGITDAQVHALVGDGAEGQRERIQPLRCQACHTTFSTRRHTPLYRLKTASDRVAEVLSALAEGLDVSAAGRVFGHHPATSTTWVTRAGEHSATLHDRWLQSLQLPHLQLDELRTRVRRPAPDLWLWLVVDPRTKLIPALHLGARTQEAAHTIIHALGQKLAPGCLPVFTRDGLNLYFYALTAHFGQWVAAGGRRARQWQVAAGLIYGQVKKRYRRRRLVGITYVMRCGPRDALRVALTGLGWSGRLNTAFVERINLTVRQSVAALLRRTWSIMQEAPHLRVHLEWWRAYYHFVRPHESLRVALGQPVDRGGNRQPQRYRQRPPAMAGGLTSRRWTVRELLALPLPPEPLAGQQRRINGRQVAGYARSTARSASTRVVRGAGSTRKGA